jgi:transcriptional regulator with XRE-family HTH domain
MTRKTKATGVRGDAFLATQLRNPEFRRHFEQRRLVHEVAIAVRAMRAGAGLTQAELARRIGTSQPTIARIEKGLDQHTPQWDTLQRIAVALGRQLRLRFVEPRADTLDSPIVEVPGTRLRRRPALRPEEAVHDD